MTVCFLPTPCTSFPECVDVLESFLIFSREKDAVELSCPQNPHGHRMGAVSYTHLTLPTKLSV